MTRQSPGRCARTRLGAATLCAMLLLASGCVTRVVRTPVLDENNVQVYLRQHLKGGKPVDHGFSHPVSIAPVRVTNILARIEVRDEDDDRKGAREPAIPTAVLYAAGEGIAKSLTKADSTQEVVVMAIERKRTHGIFTNDHLTSLVAWVKDDRLFVYLGELDHPMSHDPKDKPKEPNVEKIVSKKQVNGGDGFVAQGPRIAAADWRSTIFRDAAVRVRPGGEVVRRTILMEEAPEEDPTNAPGPAPPPEGLSPEALRALADLEEERRRGQLTEPDYQARRREILSGKTPSPGDPQAP
jgi:hypothetical protein